jgi:hypothetical protein
LCGNYQKNSGVNVICIIKSVDSGSDPFEVEVNSTIVVLKDNITYNHKINQNISILGVYPQDRFSTDSQGSASIPDPLPFIKCKKFGGLSIKNGRINYGSSLTKYLREEDGSKVYENASSPYYIRKCPYDPYQSHGNSSQYKTIKNCIDNGYYHESNDGSCLLCRLEGKSTCKHYGFETFVKLAPSQNQNTTRAPCSIDHVIFSCGNFYEHYPGESVEYYLNGNISSVIFLDNGHKTKYGV